METIDLLSISPINWYWDTNNQRQCVPNPVDTLYCEGNTALINTPCITIIGTRKPTERGAQQAFNIARYFARRGFTIVSGLALGIDSAAHRGALAVGGNTIAVLGTPLTRYYPSENRDLQREIAQRGLLITEYNDHAYDPNRFVVRDRIQAYLSVAVMPVECGQGSGTFHAINAARATNKLLIVPQLPPPAERRVQHNGIEQCIKWGAHVCSNDAAEQQALLDELHARYARMK